MKPKCKYCGQAIYITPVAGVCFDCVFRCRRDAAFAASVRKGGDVQQAPAESPQSGPKGNAQ